MVDVDTESSPDRERILVAVDFSEYSRRALATAARLATSLGAELVVLHVINDPAEAPGFYRLSKKKSLKKTRKRLKTLMESAEDIMEAFMKLAGEEDEALAALSELRTVLVHGVPVFRILEMARQERVSFIVMGSHGRTGPEHLLLGSKAERVVRLSPGTVVVVK